MRLGFKILRERVTQRLKMNKWGAECLGFIYFFRVIGRLEFFVDSEGGSDYAAEDVFGNMYVNVADRAREFSVGRVGECGSRGAGFFVDDFLRVAREPHVHEAGVYGFTQCDRVGGRW